MNPLSEMQLDALMEIFNIGAGRAAASLSQIVSDEIALSVPQIKFVPASEINTALISFGSKPLTMVEQTFSGPYEIKASLLFNENNTLSIVRDMMKSQLDLEDLVEFEEEAMCELGNIILNACMSAMSAMFDITLNSTLPSYSIGNSEEVLGLLCANMDQPMMMVMHVDLAIQKHEARGSLIFVLSSHSFHNLLVHVDQYIASF